MTQGDPARITDLDVFPSLICWDQPFSLDLIYRPSDAATDPIEAVLNAFLANVWAALMADPQWTNQAIDTVIGPPAWWIDADGGAVGATLTATVRFRTGQDDLTTQ
jgi:hypothetical protein